MSSVTGTYPVKLSPPTRRSGNPAPHRAELECHHRRHVIEDETAQPETPSLLDVDSRNEPWLWPTETGTSSSLQTNGEDNQLGTGSSTQQLGVCADCKHDAVLLCSATHRCAVSVKSTHQCGVNCELNTTVEREAVHENFEPRAPQRLADLNPSRA